MKQKNKMKTEKEWNLSNKELTPHMFYEYQGGFTKEDVKEFIRRLKDLFQLEPFASKIKKDIDKLAGDKLK